MSSPEFSPENLYPSKNGLVPPTIFDLISNQPRCSNLEASLEGARAHLISRELWGDRIKYKRLGIAENPEANTLAEEEQVRVHHLIFRQEVDGKYIINTVEARHDNTKLFRFEDPSKNFVRSTFTKRKERVFGHQDQLVTEVFVFAVDPQVFDDLVNDNYPCLFEPEPDEATVEYVNYEGNRYAMHKGDTVLQLFKDKAYNYILILQEDGPPIRIAGEEYMKTIKALWGKGFGYDYNPTLSNDTRYVWKIAREKSAAAIVDDVFRGISFD